MGAYIIDHSLRGAHECSGLRMREGSELVADEPVWSVALLADAVSVFQDRTSGPSCQPSPGQLCLVKFTLGPGRGRAVAPADAHTAQYLQGWWSSQEGQTGAEQLAEADRSRVLKQEGGSREMGNGPGWL